MQTAAEQLPFGLSDNFPGTQELSGSWYQWQAVGVLSFKLMCQPRVQMHVTKERDAGRCVQGKPQWEEMNFDHFVGCESHTQMLWPLRPDGLHLIHSNNLHKSTTVSQPAYKNHSSLFIKQPV